MKLIKKTKSEMTFEITDNAKLYSESWDSGRNVVEGDTLVMPAVDNYEIGKEYKEIKEFKLIEKLKK